MDGRINIKVVSHKREEAILRLEPSIRECCDLEATTMPIPT